MRISTIRLETHYAISVIAVGEMVFASVQMLFSSMGIVLRET